MSIKSRLDKLERPTESALGYCTHQPAQVSLLCDDGSGQEIEQGLIAEAPEITACWCGAPPILIRVMPYEMAAGDLEAA
jgi:hypothetical protein